MSPMAFIPPSLQVYARAALLLLLVAAGAVTGWTVNGWRLGTDLQALKAEHAQTVADAHVAAAAATAREQAKHEALAADLALQSAAFYEDLTRKQHEIDTLRTSVATGTRVVRIAATCPAGAGELSQTAGGGRVDPAAGAVLAPADGQRVLDLRAGIVRREAQLAACQQALILFTGQPRPERQP